MRSYLVLVSLLLVIAAEGAPVFAQTSPETSSGSFAWEERFAELEAEVAHLRLINNLRVEESMPSFEDIDLQPTRRVNAAPSGALFPNLTIDSRFVLETQDKAYKLQIDGMLISRYEVSRQSDDGTGSSAHGHRFNKTGTRVNFRGRVHEHFSYWFRLNFDGDVGFSDAAVVVYHVNENLNIGFGQFPSVLNRETASPADLLTAVEASATNTVFDPTIYQGVIVGFHLDKLLLRGIASDGIFAISDVFDNPTDADYALAGQLGWMLVGDEDDYGRFANFTSRPGSDLAILLDGSFSWQQGSRDIDPGGRKSDLLIGIAQASVEGDGWNFYSSFNYRYTDPSSDGFQANDYGFVIQGGAWIATHFESYARFDMTIPDNARPTEGNEFKTIATGVIYYPFPESDNIKLTTEFLYMPDSESASIVDPNRFSSVYPADGEQWVIRVQAILRW